jgi:hypothetical protein
MKGGEPTWAAASELWIAPAASWEFLFRDRPGVKLALEKIFNSFQWVEGNQPHGLAGANPLWSDLSTIPRFQNGWRHAAATDQ